MDTRFPEQSVTLWNYMTVNTMAFHNFKNAGLVIAKQYILAIDN